MAYVMNFVWGLQDSGLNILMMSILGFEFEDKTTPFSVYNFVMGLSVFGMELIGSLVINSDFEDAKEIRYVNIYISVAGAFGTFSLLIMFFFTFKKAEQKVEEEEEKVEALNKTM
jgi:hypothetical protein